ncbi:lipoyl synthase [Candidatus Micrarchaeota archaeon]|nr:lipoyl synthase [Candidatus Micrarchaeota archaeon]
MANSPPVPAKASRESIKEVTTEIIRKHDLRSPCEACRNFSRCSIVGSAAFTLMGPHCTRNCKFCVIKHNKKPGRLENEEPERLAATIRALGLRHVILTSVSRDDLDDMGAEHFARCIRAIKRWNPHTAVEVSIPDFSGKKELIKKVVDAGPDIIGHSIETVRRLQPVVRDGMHGYGQSLRTIRAIRELSRDMIIKSSLMLGFREQRFEVLAALRHLRKAGTDIVTIGQYLRPTKNHLQVLEYVPKDAFEFYEREAYQLGYKHVIAKSSATHSYPSREMLALMHGL